MLSRKACLVVLWSALTTGTLLSAEVSVSRWSSTSEFRPTELILSDNNGISLDRAENRDCLNPLAAALLGPTIYDETFNASHPPAGFGHDENKDSGASEWEYLWHNAARLPINAVPEPTTAAILVAGMVLLARRNQRRN